MKKQIYIKLKYKASSQAPLTTQAQMGLPKQPFLKIPPITTINAKLSDNGFKKEECILAWDLPELIRKDGDQRNRKVPVSYK